MSSDVERKPWDSNPQSRFIGTPVFKTGSSSGRMTSIELRGLESNQRPPGSEPGVATSSNHPAVLSLLVRHASRKGSGRRIRTSVAWFKGRQPTVSRSPRVPCGSRTRLSSLEGWRLCRSAKGTCVVDAEGEGVEPSRLIARRFSKPLPSPVGLPFRKAAVTGIEPVSGRLTAACSYQHELHRNAVSVVRFELTISCAQGRRIPRLSHTLVRLSRMCAVRISWTTTRELKSTQRESNPHFRHGEPVGFHYIMGANVLIGLSKNHAESTGPPYRVVPGSNPRCRITGAESLPLNDQCLLPNGIRRT